MKFNKRLLQICILSLLSIQLSAFSYGPENEVKIEITHIAVDTIPIIDGYGDFLTDPNTNPFDINPSNIEQKVEYDPESNQYVIFEKIGEEYYKTPVTMTFQEYLDWTAKEDERRYFQKLAGVGDEYKSKSGILDPISKVDIKDDIVDRLFGGSGVTIKPQGNIDLTFLPLQYQFNGNPNIFVEQQSNYIWLDFDPVIQMSVDGGIGDKMNLGFNYNTQSTFDFDQKIKLEYDSEAFNEDDIIKKIEAGDVSFPLRSSLITGAQSLLGLKTELQFGHLRLTALASQQRSKQENLQIQNGAQVQEFEIRPDEYDENRHFFISHYHRDNYEKTLENLPYLNTAFRINRIQVWVSNDRPEFQENSTMITAISDLAEGDENLFSSANTGPFPQNQLPGGPVNVFQPIDVIQPVDPIYIDRDGNILPDNRINTLYEVDGLETDEDTRRIENNSTSLTSKYRLKQTEDFETFRGRLLNPSEYTFNPELGFISLNIRLKPNQVLGVAYDYYYTFNCDTLYQVGELSEESTISDVSETGEIESESVIYVKMLKSSNQKVSHPTWDLMMKNVYALRTNQLNPDDFTFDIFYEDDFSDGSLKKFLPIEEAESLPLLNMFNLDRLNSQNDPQPDGVFDFVPGVTVIPRNGSIIFPKLEPFGEGLDVLLDLGVTEEEIKRFKFESLYDEPIIVAREQLELNKFVMVGEYKSSVSSEIALGAWNLPQGSLRVRAGSQLLIEGVDYEVDYGSGRLRILNETYLQQGVPLDIQFEDTSVFSFQQKTMIGLRADYALSKHSNIGATYLRLKERPFTEKVNIGDDPIQNQIFGLDFDYSKEAPWITKAVDKLPFYSTKEPSNILFTAEVAALKPGHSKGVNLSGGDNDEDADKGVVSIDDFEGAVSGLPLGTQTNRWSLSSVPTTLGDDMIVPESSLTNDLALNANRALMNWFVADRGGSEAFDDSHPYTRRVLQDELFNRQVAQSQLRDLFTFDISYYPGERGPYNFDVPTGYPGYSAGIGFNDTTRTIQLLEPESRWAGITRYMINNDFQATNYEFIDFWMLNPYMERPDDAPPHKAGEKGKMIFHLGSVSEDIMKDNLQFYENAIPVQDQQTPVRETDLGVVPLDIPVNNGFTLENQADQDLGFDGLNDIQEGDKFQGWINQLASTPEFAAWTTDDPANDNFLFYGDPSLTGRGIDLLTKYKRFNHPQGNAPTGNDRVRGNPIPDAEDLNNNKSLDQAEAYYEYVLDIVHDGNGEIDITATDYITDIQTVEKNNFTEKWYRVRIPINDGKAVGGIEGFRSIQFMRLLATGFSTPKTMRLAEFELVRNQWRKLPVACEEATFSLDVIGVEENAEKEPFGYEVPEGIKQERLFSTIGNVLQDEKSLSINFENLPDTCEVSIYKLTELDMRFFENLQMFVHAEGEDESLEDGDLSIFLRIGKDFVNNYYEYEIPLTLSDPDDMVNVSTANQVWRPENKFDFALKSLTDLKKIRDELAFPNLERFSSEDQVEFSDLPDGHKIYLKGNPTLGFVKGIQVGVRNIETGDSDIYNGEVWINELRAVGFKEQGGFAGLSRLDVQMADLGNVTLSGSYSSIGYGGLDQKLQERSLEEIIEYDAATNLELGKFLPKNWNVSIPFYAQYAKSISNPLYDAYALDLTLDEVKDVAIANGRDTDDIVARSQDVTTIKTINFTNVRKQRSTGNKKDKNSQFDPIGKDVRNPVEVEKNVSNKQTNKKEKEKKNRPMPWDISNFSVSYSYTEIEHRDPFLSIDDSKDYRAGLDYTYSNRFKGFKPFDKLVNKPAFKIIKEINFNPVPSSFSFNTNVNRFISQRRFRLPDTPVFEFDDRIFDWRRRYNLKWDLMKNLKLTFAAENRSIIDELRQTGIATQPEDRDWVDEKGISREVNDMQEVESYWRENLMSGGRNSNYNHQLALNYTLPTKHIKLLSWINVKASYKSDYTWTAGPLIIIDDLYGLEPGAVIQNGQDRSLTGTFNFDKLYSKSKYLKRIESGKKAKKSRRGTTAKKEDSTGATASAGSRKDTKKKEREISKAERFLVRPLLSLRTVKINYKENLSTLVPGFLPTSTLFGLGERWTAPGWQFVGGLQPNLDYNDPNSFLRNATDNEWINPSPEFNQQISQNQRQNFDATINIEPWKYFKIDVDLSKSYNKAHTQEFKNKEDPFSPDFQQFALNDVGTFEVSYLNFNTLFDQDIDGLFRRFLGSRSIISERLDQEVPVNGTIILDNGETYREGFRKSSTQVMIPAFLATYTGLDPNSVTLDLEKTISSNTYIPAPNWKLRYDGLTKMPRFKEIFSSFTIDHAYRSTMSISQFRTDPLYEAPTASNPLAPYQNINVKTNNYYSRLDIPSISIQEQFAPLIGITIKTKSDFILDAEWRKSRNLELTAGINGATLMEVRSTGFEGGIGYTFKNVEMFGKKKKKKGRTSRTRQDNPNGIGNVLDKLGQEDDDKAKADDDDDDAKKGKRSKKGVNNERGSDLICAFDFGLKDDVTYLHEETNLNAEPVRGTRTLTLQPSIEYEVNKNLSWRAFMSWRNSVPYATNQYPNRNFQLGITLRFKLD